MTRSAATQRLAASHSELKKFKKQYESYDRAINELFARRDACVAELKRQLGNLNEIRGEIESGSAQEEAGGHIRTIESQIETLKTFQWSFPQENHRIFRIIFGSVNVTLFRLADRYAYKKEYESFKIHRTMVALAASILLYALGPGYRGSEHVFHFYNMACYVITTLRELILIANGSRIRGWWLLHHYLSIMATSIMAVWHNSPHYLQIRPTYLSFIIFISTLSILQYNYQMKRLYKMIALNKAHAMDTSSEVAVGTTWSFSFLLIFLLIGYMWEFLLSYQLMGIAQGIYNDESSSNGMWQSICLSLLFAILGVGNMLTTLRTAHSKFLKG